MDPFAGGFAVDRQCARSGFVDDYPRVAYSHVRHPLLHLLHNSPAGSYGRDGESGSLFDA